MGLTSAIQWLRQRATELALLALLVGAAAQAWQLHNARQALAGARAELQQLQLGIEAATAKAQALAERNRASQIQTIRQAETAREHTRQTRQSDLAAAAAARSGLHQRTQDLARGPAATPDPASAADQPAAQQALLAAMAAALDRLAAEGERIAERADAHAADALMLRNAWPQNPQPDNR